MPSNATFFVKICLSNRQHLHNAPSSSTCLETSSSPIDPLENQVKNMYNPDASLVQMKMYTVATLPGDCSAFKQGWHRIQAFPRIQGWGRSQAFSGEMGHLSLRGGRPGTSSSISARRPEPETKTKKEKAKAPIQTPPNSVPSAVPSKPCQSRTRHSMPGPNVSGPYVQAASNTLNVRSVHATLKSFALPI